MLANLMIALATYTPRRSVVNLLVKASRWLKSKFLTKKASFCYQVKVDSFLMELKFQEKGMHMAAKSIVSWTCLMILCIKFEVESCILAGFVPLTQ